MTLCTFGRLPPSSVPSGVLAHGEVFTSVARQAGRRAGPLPDGLVRISWRDHVGVEQSVDVAHWWRLDNWLIPVGSVFRVEVEARERRDLRFPAHRATGWCLLTCDPADRLTVSVGTVEGNGWRFGLAMQGVRVDAETALP